MRMKSLVLAVVLLAGCPAVKSFKAGETAEASGDDWRAAHHYLDALDRRGGYDKASEGLARTAADGWTEGVGQARRLEQAEDYLTAMEWYQSLQRYVSRLERRNALSFEVDVDLDDKVEEMRAAAAYVAYARGEDLIRTRQWADSIAKFEEARSIAPDFKDSDERIAEVRYLWAAEEVTQGQYRSAAERFGLAVSAEGLYHEDADERAAELWAALGRHHLAVGTCRQAVRDLRMAARRYPVEIAGDLEEATACATTRVRIDNLSGRIELQGIDAGTWLSDALRRELPSEVSEFVVVLDPGARSVGGNKGSAQYVVSGSVTEGWIQGPTVNQEVISVAGTRQRTCNEGEFAPCLEPVNVRYTKTTSVLTGRVTAQVRVVDGATQGVVRELPSTAASDSTLVWAQDFVDANGNAVPVGTEASGSTVALAADVIAMRDANRTHPAPADISRRLLERVADELTSGIAGVVDSEPALRDPARLEIVALDPTK